MPTDVPESRALAASKKRRQILGRAAVFLPLASALAGMQLSKGGQSTMMTPPAVRRLAAVRSTDMIFKTGCGDLPFQRIAVPHWLDDHCGIEGRASDPANRQQNRLKNNFCLHSEPVVIKPADLVTLQADVDARDIKYGHAKTVPLDRSPLQRIRSISRHSVGEGTLVRLVGYVIDAHYADVNDGEGVNCSQKRKEQNDIHFSISDHYIDLKADHTERRLQLCKLVTGEISPHYRPASWEVEYLRELAHVPVRLSGQLFFDASHQPCRPGKVIYPARKSVWEIHPIYSIDVCKNPAMCRADVESDWLSLDAWVDDLQ